MAVDLDSEEHAVCSAALARRQQEVVEARAEGRRTISQMRHVLLAVANDYECDADREGFHVKWCRRCEARKVLGVP